MFEPRYQISPKTLSNMTGIAEIKAVVERSRVLPLNEAQLRRQAILRMAHTSTSIEGNKLAEFEVGKVLEGKSVRASQKDVLEVENYYQALKILEDMAKIKKDISPDEILRLHKIVIEGLVEKEKTAKFRPSDVYVLDDLGDGREMLRFKAPPASSVAKLIKDLLDWLKQSKKDRIHPIIRAGILHLQFVTIHPFTDGNGRVARLLTQLQLYRDNWDFRKILVLEDYYNRDRLSYYKAENLAQGKQYEKDMDFSGWLEYFTTGFLIEARKALEQIQSIGFGRISKKSEQVFLDRDEILIMDFLTTTGRITSDDVTDILKVAKRSAQLKLKKLVDNGLVKPQGKGPSTYYVIAITCAIIARSATFQESPSTPLGTRKLT
ncbi:Fic family protein [Candidatus Daviesbacteria bacterium]|nr:Fic family protein [Candidatus Daviesbacteria bacterium]